MRLFIAIDASIDDFCREIQESIKQPGLRLTNSFHLTLKFLGDVDSPDSIIAELDKVKFQKFTIKTTDIGSFPDLRHPRVIWLGIEESKELRQLHKEIEKSLSRFDFRKEFDFTPHLTLARVENDIKGIFEIKPEPKTIEVIKFILYKSTLFPSGPKYDIIKEFKESS